MLRGRDTVQDLEALKSWRRGGSTGRRTLIEGKTGGTGWCLTRLTGEGQTATVIGMQEGGVQGVEVQEETTVANGGEEAQKATGRNIVTGTVMAEEIEVDIVMTMVTTSGADEARHTMENELEWAQPKMDISDLRLWPARQNNGESRIGHRVDYVFQMAIEH